MTINKYLISDSSQYHTLFNNIDSFSRENIIIYLTGDLGSGKTFFVKKYLEYKYSFNDTSSPTFGIVNSYSIDDFYVYHYDLYRIEKSSELDDIGFYENLEIKACHLIEWPEIIPVNHVTPDIIINFNVVNDHRIISIKLTNE